MADLMSTIDGVRLYPLAELADVRGSVRRFVRADDPWAEGGIAEVYFSTVLPGVVKGWHVHTKMTLRYCCVVGEILVGLCDGRPGSRTFGYLMRTRLAATGPADHKILIIPPGVWNGFRCAPEWPARAILANAPDMVHDPEEVQRESAEKMLDGIGRAGPHISVEEFWGAYAVSG